MIHTMSARLSLVVLLGMLAVIQASGQCRVDSYGLIADARRRPQVHESLPGLDGEIYLLLRRSGSDTLSNGAGSDSSGYSLLKYDASFELIWWRDLRSRRGIEMALDSNGQLLLSGVEASFDGVMLTSDPFPFIARLAVDGSIDTVISIRSAGALPLERTGRLALSNRYIYYIGRRVDTTGVVVVQMDYQGNTLWTRHAETGRYGYDGIDLIEDVAVDREGNVYVAGQYQVEVIFGRDTLRSGAGSRVIDAFAFFVVTWDADGEFRWGLNRIRRAGNDVINWSNQFLLVNDEHLYIAAHDPEGARFANGPDTVSVGPLFLAKVTLDRGAIRWVQSYDFTPAGSHDRDLDIEAGPSGEVVFSTTSPSSGRGVFRYDNGDSLAVPVRDQLIARFDHDGNIICATTLAEAFWTDITTDRSGNIHIVGSFGDSIVFNRTDTVRSSVAPRWTLYLARFGSRQLAVPIDPDGAAALSIYPNPASGNITVALPEESTGPVDVRLSTMLGATVFGGRYEATRGGALWIPVSGLPSGIYLLHVFGVKKSLQQRVVITR